MKHLNLSIAALLLIFGTTFLQAQVPYNYVDTIPVIKGSKALRFPWAGGLKAPQYSAIDLNGDGIKDLFVFDRSGNRVRTFLNGGAQDSVDYDLAREYHDNFPSELSHWTLLYDYDCDGDADIFTAAENFVRAWKNDGNPGPNLSFTSAANPIMTMYGPNALPVYADNANLPALTDVDLDGDMDFLVMGIGGIFVAFHKNLAMEDYGDCDHLEYTLEDECWGHYTDDTQTNLPLLNQFCRQAGETERTLHPDGSNLLALDLDADRDKDMIQGNNPGPTIFSLTNGGDTSSAHMTSYTLNYPVNSTRVEIDDFPANFYVDVDNDDVRDLLSSTSLLQVTKTNLHHNFRYHNSGADDNPVFNYEQDNFLMDDMIEAGTNSHPALFDADGDGDLDLLVGNYSMVGVDSGTVRFYRNTGTGGSNEYTFETSNYMNIADMGILDIAIAMGDMDADGDEDMVLGGMDGYLHYLENIPDTAGEANFIYRDTALAMIHAGQMVRPLIYDADQDSIPDLLVGRLDGKLLYYRNYGTAQAFSFQASPETNSWGGVGGQLAMGAGYIHPWVATYNGIEMLLVAQADGKIRAFTGLAQAQTTPLSLVDSLLVPGLTLSIYGGDINGDGDDELFVGCQAGGLEILDFSIVVGAEEAHATGMPKVSLYPNPASESCRLHFESLPKGPVSVQMYNLEGKLMRRMKFPTGVNAEIGLQGLSDGLYLLRIAADGQESFAKLALQR